MRLKKYESVVKKYLLIFHIKHVNLIQSHTYHNSMHYIIIISSLISYWHPCCCKHTDFFMFILNILYDISHLRLCDFSPIEHPQLFRYAWLDAVINLSY